jgi:hypothetical protein
MRITMQMKYFTNTFDKKVPSPKSAYPDLLCYAILCPNPASHDFRYARNDNMMSGLMQIDLSMSQKFGL